MVSLIKRPRIGDRVTMTAANGHRFEYRVIGFYDNGHVKTAQYDAWHAEDCNCRNWEGEDQNVPDW